MALHEMKRDAFGEAATAGRPDSSAEREDDARVRPAPREPGIMARVGVVEPPTPGGDATRQPQGGGRKDISRSAEVRLARLMNEGVVTSLGVVRNGAEQKAFVGIDANASPDDPKFDAAVDAVCVRLKESLQDIPFEIISGGHAEPREKDAGVHGDAFLPKASALALAPRDGPQPRADAAEGPASDAAHEAATPPAPADPGRRAAVPLRADAHPVLDASAATEQAPSDRLKRLEDKLDALLKVFEPEEGGVRPGTGTVSARLARLEARVDCLPSRGFVITATLVVLATVAPAIVFPTRMTGPFLSALGLR